ncbi:DUF4942 domain-containing protein [Maribacter polysaccharolyticus]|uniref:DUF4942 domain-containing protein n=1 Tax=Maribacter polysaccharolyticus TaxID=3020831 RepID=UPI00237F3319|nr:DUF4942 domain-containing protein [Maribacter polysaccharolyticus]MDE3744073.1 DUF4942 domain-containing protein [Maribacter polysaccharolyticus]
MFGQQFYPTPPEVIKRMLAPYSGKIWKGGINGGRQDSLCYGLLDKVVLDPSAGKGDILNFIKKDLSDHARRSVDCDLNAIEIDPNLQSILRDNEISLLGNDFLTYQRDIFFDVILMNPPFKNGDAHLLKAIEIAHDTDIVCLLNAETLLNPHTQKRKELLQMIEKYGNYEVIGNVFDNAERKTDVNVALVRLKVTKEEQTFEFDFSDYEPEKIEFDDSFVKNEVARKDLIGNMMIQFEQAKKAYKEYIEAQKKWQHYTNFVISHDTYSEPKDYDKQDLPPMKRYNHFNNRIKATMWRTVIKELNMDRYMTSKVQSNFELFIQQQSAMSFTKENVHDLFHMLVNNSGTILEQAIIDVFEMLTENYYSENRMTVPGWKTNDRYKVNKKIIAPVYVRYGEYMNSYDLKQYGDKFSLGYRGETKYADIDRVLCYISGKSYEKITTIKRALENKFDQLGKVYTGQKFDNTCSSTFFDIRFHKKGTVHLTFKDTFLWQEFNMRACDGKQWLPDNERTQWEAKKKKAREQRKAKTEPIRIGEQPKPIKKRTTKPRKVSQFSNELLDLFT